MYASGLINASAVELFERSAVAFPERIAVRDGDREITYQELNRRANQLAHIILTHNTGNVPIPILLGHDISTVIAILGIIKTGCPFVVLDPSYPTERNQLILSDLEARLLITDRKHQEIAKACKPSASHILLINQDELLAHLDVNNPEIIISPEALFCVMFTSGSTGKPKGVMCSHRFVVFANLQAASLQNLSPEDSLSIFTPFTYVASISLLLRTFFVGACACLYDARILGLAGLAQWLDNQGITVIVSPTSTLRAIFTNLSIDSAFQHVRYIQLGGEGTNPADIYLMQAHTTSTCIFAVTLSMTETLTITWSRVDHSMAVPDTAGLIGNPLPDHEIYLLDDNRQPVNPGKVGEVVVRSRYISSGYWKQPKLTAEKFLPDPRDPQVRTFFTGDMARFLPDGSLQYLGRNDNLVKIRGFRVEISEVETALSRHPAIQQAIVISQPDPNENSEKRLVAYYVPRLAADPDEFELRKYLTALLPPFMVPSRFISLESLPLSPNGKVDVRALPDPTQDAAVIEPSSVNSEEKVLLNIWARVFSRDRIGLQDDFFELGGNSLIAIRILTAVEEQLGVNYPLPFLEKCRTIQQMAEYIRITRGSHAASSNQENLKTRTGTMAISGDSNWMQGVVPIQPEGPTTPLFVLSSGLYMRGFALKFAPDRPVYGLFPIENGQIIFRGSVQETARDYYRNLVEYRPRGPYLLLGHSANGFFALELARLLIQNGKKDVFVGLLDSYPPGHRTQARFLDRIKIHLENLQGRDLRGMVKYIGEASDRFSDRLFQHKVWQGRDRIQQARDMNRVRYLAHLHYQPEPIAFPVTLFSARERPWYVYWDPMENWHKFLTGSFDRIRIPGDHMTALEPPHSAKFVEIIKERVQRFEKVI